MPAVGLSTLLLNFVLAAAYFVTGRLGLQIAGYADSVTLVWAPAGIGLAALALYGPRLWPGLALGAFGVNLGAGLPVPVALGIATGNTLGALAGLALFQRVGVQAACARRRDVAGLFLAAVAFPLVSASVGIASLRLGGVLAPEQVPGAWLWWWVGDGVGVLLVTPVLLTCLSAKPRWLPPRRSFETAALASILVATAASVFLDWLPGGGAHYPLSFAVVPPLAWAATRFGPRGAALAAFATAAIAVAGTLARHGPFAGYALQQSLLFLELLVSVLGALAFLLAAEVSERERGEERFRLLSENASDLIGELDAEGNVLYVSPSVRTILGLELEDAEVRDVRAALETTIHPDDLPALGSELANVRASPGARFARLFRARHRSGDWRWLEIHAHSFEAGDRTFHVLCASRDVTDRVRAEDEARRLTEQALQTQKLEGLGVLTGGIAHDFNNLLAGMLVNATHALSETPPGSASARALRDLEMAIQRAGELTQQMLAYAGKAPLVTRLVDLSDLVAEMHPLLGASLSKKARVSFRLARDLPPIECDPSQIRQIVMNLLANASEALGTEEGWIDVETRRGEPDADGRESVLLEVRDTGCGMDGETRARMFDPFFTTKAAGRGLGLAAALGVVTRHRGRLDVESAVGKGTVVRLQLPASPRQAPRAAAAAPSDPWRPGGTILVAEDDLALRLAVERMLSAVGFAVLGASDGREALEVFTAHADEIDAVLLDLTMPVLSGAEVLPALRALRSGVPVVVWTGYSEAELASRLGREKPDVVLSKPLQPSDLLEGLRQALERPKR